MASLSRLSRSAGASTSPLPELVAGFFGNIENDAPSCSAVLDLHFVDAIEASNNAAPQACDRIVVCRFGSVSTKIFFVTAGAFRRSALRMPRALHRSHTRAPT